ncbi:SRPBCC family protein [Phycicoccus sp. Soil748]|uniref:SRPBCC family protein n=1 Tax=Phycicoccus sp. Soil748 TaxID=1736397 RepID=UPI000703203F|nr:SRPBCC family protein [Phycicoccus sp. Soil748]KRE54947.1 hypothetical protein ASG70_05735 [Phycicoccus sp. Soil748]
MAALHLVRETSATPAQVWDVVAAFDGYGAWMPMTRMVTDEGQPRVGWGFAGLTGLGRLAFSDSMLVTRWDPPADGTTGVFRVVKTGRLLGGWAEVTVSPREDGGSRLDWVEDVVVRPLPFKRFFDPLLDRASAWLYGRAIDAMLVRAASRRIPR